MSSFAKPVGINVSAGSVPIVQTFEAFYQTEYRSVLALAFVLTGHRTEAEDLAQEAFMSALKSWSSIENPPAWVRSAVSNKAMSWWRHTYAGRRANRRLDQREPVEEIPEDSADFWAKVRDLPTRQAQAVSLYYLEDRSTIEIAGILGCDVSTVRIHLSRGRKTLATRLGVTE